MALTPPTLSMSATKKLTTTSTSLHHQPHKLSTLSLNYPTTIQLKLKTIITHISLHSTPSSAFATALDSFESEDDFEDEFEEEEEVRKPVVAIEASRLYVGNLPYAMTSSELTDIFTEAGRVTSVEIVYDRVTDRSRGFGFVTMQTVDEAKDTIRMFNGALVGGRSVKVNFPEVPRGGEREVMGPKIRSSYRGFVESPYKIYAGNLSWRLTSEGLRDAFDGQPGLLSARVIYERDSGRSREVEGRPLRLNLAGENADPRSQETKAEAETDDNATAMQSDSAV
ncbi:hypothetical protein IFM89_024721 [Coptis chinensis]|uniref:RRM domain-containing protein n=1 Tax=Coptis chinensis TaxID=261450 RepID=A0A835H8L5_9MAGN|nr:hypothetical protein IFM89_024721 [Coptis chinensis]